MATGDPYATRTELKAYIGVTDATDDTKVDDALASASRGIEQYCQRQFNDAGSTSTREVEPCGDIYWLEVDDFSTTVGLVVKYDSAADGTFATTLAATTYKAYPLNGVVDGQAGWPFWKLRGVNYSWPTWWQLPPIQVTARWGWSAVPSPVKQACLLLASENLKLAREAPFGVAGFGAFGAVRVRDNPRAESMLNPYRLMPVLVG